MRPEDRIFLATVIILFLFLVVQPFFFPIKPSKPKPPVSNNQQRKEKPRTKPKEKKNPQKPKPLPPLPKTPPTLVKGPETFWIRKKDLEILFQTRGGAIRSLFLPQFQNTEKTGKLELIQFFPTPFQSLLLYDYETLKKYEKEDDPTDPAKKVTSDPLATSRWEVVEKGPQRVVFRTYLKEKKLWVEKVFDFTRRKPYYLPLELRFQNQGEKPLTFSYRLNGPSGLSIESEYYIRLEGYIAKYDRERDFVDVTYMQDSSLSSPPFLYQESLENVLWFGVGNKYFACLIHPEGLKAKTTALGAFPMLSREGKEYNLYSFYIPKTFQIPPNSQVVHRYLLFFGPKDTKVLASYPKKHFDKVVSFGWWIFAIFAKLFLAFLHFFYQFIFPNYGIAIICLTLLVRLCLLPLDYKSQRSMLILQKIQPKIKAIQEKYKGKKGHEYLQKQHQELMELYSKYGVSPLGGCLPMLLQLPVLIGLYQGLQVDISLRGAPFFGWINDLSRPDVLLAFKQPIHLIFVTIPGIHLLPLLMMVLMVIQQMMQPKSGDPQQEQQRKIFLIMIPLLGLIFYNFPSGLVLYFLCQSLVGVAVQHWILKKLKEEEAQWESE